MKINNILMILAVIGLLFAAGCASGKAGDDTITMTGTNNTNTTNGTIIITQPTTLNETNTTNNETNGTIIITPTTTLNETNTTNNETNGTIIITPTTTLNDTNQTNKSVIPPRPPKYENDTNTTVNGTNYTS